MTRKRVVLRANTPLPADGETLVWDGASGTYVPASGIGDHLVIHGGDPTHASGFATYWTFANEIEASGDSLSWAGDTLTYVKAGLYFVNLQGRWVATPGGYRYLEISPNGPSDLNVFGQFGPTADVTQVENVSMVMPAAAGDTCNFVVGHDGITETVATQSRLYVVRIA